MPALKLAVVFRWSHHRLQNLATTSVLLSTVGDRTNLLCPSNRSPGCRRSHIPGREDGGGQIGIWLGRRARREEPVSCTDALARGVWDRSCQSALARADHDKGHEAEKAPGSAIAH